MVTRRVICAISYCFFTPAPELMIPRWVVRRFDRNAIFCRHGAATVKALLADLGVGQAERRTLL
jgi:hypothetical protein